MPPSTVGATCAGAEGMRTHLNGHRAGHLSCVELHHRTVVAPDHQTLCSLARMLCMRSGFVSTDVRWGSTGRGPSNGARGNDAAATTRASSATRKQRATRHASGRGTRGSTNSAAPAWCLFQETHCGTTCNIVGVRGTQASSQEKRNTTSEGRKDSRQEAVQLRVKGWA